MSKENERIIKYCVYCGAYVKKRQVYCPECGKLVIKGKPTNDIIQQKRSFTRPIVKERVEISRKCSGCGSIITSTILDQCPICNTILEKIPEDQKTIQRKPGFVFTDKKLEPEQKFVIKKDIWNYKEGIKVFWNCLLVYITVYFIMLIILWNQIGMEESITGSVDLDMTIILLSQLPGILFGLVPLGYIYSNKHDIKKLGFSKDTNQFILAIFIGIGGGLGLLLINYFSGFINDVFSDLGLKFFDISNYIKEENREIREAGLIMQIILMIELGLAAFSTEIVFRGVLHNTLKEKFSNVEKKSKRDINDRLTVILLVALAYAGTYLFFSFYMGIILFILNFLIFLLLGVLYELNGNIYNTIIASIFYHILIVLIMIYF